MEGKLQALQIPEKGEIMQNLAEWYGVGCVTPMFN